MMQIVQCLQKLTGPFHNIRLWNLLSPCQDFIQAFPLDIIHYGIDHTVLLYKIIYLRNISLPKIFQHVHFSSERLFLRGK